jgi:type II secretory pathway pseudopilin PulG
MNRHGTVLVAVLVISALAAMVAASLMYRVRAEAAALHASDSGERAYAAAMSGLHRALTILTEYRDGIDLWTDNEDLFRDQLVADDGANRWYFTIYAHNPDDHERVRYGLTDEAGKINVNFAPEAVLTALAEHLEHMNSAHVACLLDYRDTDDERRPEGAEQPEYDRLAYPITIRNRPQILTLEELLLVEGFTAHLIYGEDANLNGRLDPNEADGEDSFPPDDRDSVLDRGLRGLATSLSYERNVDSQGSDRININGSEGDLNKLAETGLPEQTIEFIKRYRAEGNTFAHPGELLNMEYEAAGEGGEPERGGRRRGRGRGARGGGESEQGGLIRSGVGAEELPAVMDKLTTESVGRRSRLVGLVNVNTASAQVLECLPGIDAQLAARIVETRRALGGEARATTAWLYTEDVADEATFKKIAPLLTARGYQFQMCCVGFGRPSGRFRVLEAVIDLAGDVPRIAYLRDLTRLGMPFALDAETKEFGR